MDAETPVEPMRSTIDPDPGEPEYYAQRSPEALADELTCMIERVREARRMSGFAGRVRRNWLMYYGLDDGYARLDDNLYATGQGGEQVRLRANHYRNIMQHMLVMTTNTRPVMDCKAANTDEKSIRQATIANSVIEHYFETADVWKFVDRAVEEALVETVGYIHTEWDASAGDAYEVGQDDNGDPDPSKLIFQGDLKFSNPGFYDVFYDPSAESFDEVSDVIVRSWRNKYDLIARFPDLEEKIDSQETKKQWNSVHLELPTIFFNPYDTNLIEMFTYYHKRSAAVPKGRMSIFTADGTVLYDGELPYSRLPLFRVSAAEMMHTPQGYSPATDIASLQEAVDRLGSSIFTNLAAFGVQNIAIPRGSNIQIDALDGGLNAVHYNETPGPSGGLPTPLQLTKSPPEAFKFLEVLIGSLESISGVNSVARGNPPPGMDAGVALSLVQTMAIQFMNGLQKSYAAALRELAYFIIDTLRTYAQAPRLINIVGVGKQSALKEFVGSDLEGVQRVTVDLGNPMARTVAGRMQIAKALLDSGMAMDPKQYLQVLESGRLEPMTESADAQLNLVRSENERLLQGIPCAVLGGDDDVTHLKEHLALLSNPDVRENGMYVQTVLQHVNDHVRKYGQGDAIVGVTQGILPPGFMSQPQMPPGAAGPQQQHGGKPPAGPPGPHNRPGAPHAPHAPPSGMPPGPRPQAAPMPQQGTPPPMQQRRPPAPRGAPPGVLPQPNFPTPAPQPPVM